MIKHIRLGKDDEGQFAGYQFIKVYIEKGVDLDKLQDTITKVIPAVSQLVNLSRANGKGKGK